MAAGVTDHLWMLIERRSGLLQAGVSGRMTRFAVDTLEVLMLGRVATFDHLVPDELSSRAVQLLRETVRHTPGYVAGFHLHDPKSTKAMSIVVVEDPDAAKAISEALGRRADDEKVGIDPGISR